MTRAVYVHERQRPRAAASIEADMLRQQLETERWRARELARMLRNVPGLLEKHGVLKRGGTHSYESHGNEGERFYKVTNAGMKKLEADIEAFVKMIGAES